MMTEYIQDYNVTMKLFILLVNFATVLAEILLIYVRYHISVNKHIEYFELLLQESFYGDMPQKGIC